MEDKVVVKKIIKNILPYFISRRLGMIRYTMKMRIESTVGKIKYKDWKLLKVIRQDCPLPIFLREKTSDVGTYWDIFFKSEYNFTACKEPEIIIDAGANIGLTSVYFANKFPHAKIIAIEPESGNFEVLLMNIKNYPNIFSVNAALWNECGEIDILNVGLGNNGFMTGSESDHAILKTPVFELKNKVTAVTVEKIMKDFNIDTVDILKIDIEGAEKEVFENSDLWIQKINVIIIELHERLKDGCCRVFYNKTNGFDSEWSQGDSIFLVKNNVIIKAD
jgi:FkbM family methyltransferase